jgi:uncharacterized protein YyaL (SSP411 family)
MPSRLATQASPYLLQHASNPVDWWPWGPEAFAEARRRDVPIFLSIGYSTCYWCHVMERESFEHEGIAALLNRDFLPVKVDREERPDLDELYMAATVTMTGHGGWPMSVFLEPHALKPFYCGTYFPAEERPHYGRPSFPQLLDAMRMAWVTQRQGVIDQAEQVAAAVAEHLATRHAPVRIGHTQVADALSGLTRSFDQLRGGFGAAPKFPQPSNLDFLLDVLEVATEPATTDPVRHIVASTLSAMMSGGLFDQVGGGFHRYSVDASWTVPHFEKMLYDNAMLAATYARAARDLEDPAFARIAHRTLDAMLRDLRDPSGLFRSAIDAEVDHREGLNYLWTPEQVAAALSPDDAALAIRLYGLDQPANFQDPHHPPTGDDDRTWVLRLGDRPERLAAREGLDPDALLDRLDRINDALLAVRSRRKQPHLDDKCIAAWNGLAIRGLATAGAILERPDALDAARAAADAAWTLLVRDGVLHRSIRHDRLGPPGVLEDYALVVQGLVAVHRATGDAAARFVDVDGLVHDTEAHASDLFVRATATHDGAVPSGFSSYLHARIDLHDATGSTTHLDECARSLAAHSAAIDRSPLGTINAVAALLRLLVRSEQLPEPLATAPEPERSGKGRRKASEVDPVEVLAAAERVTLTPEQPHASFTVRLQIAAGWHIAAASAEHHPLRLSIVNGSGVNVYADYPAPTHTLGIDGLEVPVCTGTLDIPVVLERDATIPRQGQPLIAVSYLACSDTECLEPAAVELDIAIDV